MSYKNTKVAEALPQTELHETRGSGTETQPATGN
jgi:hypothetical protein